MICSSVNLVLFISSVLLSGPDSNQTWMKIRGSRHVLKNIDELFQHDDMLAAPDWGIDITSDFNSGVLSFTPSEELRSRVYSSLYILESADGGDQGFLNSLFGDEVKRLADRKRKRM